ncbi:MAG TPA: hypothetical protein VG474_04515 [Solirubrobacteraceae bacterium]|nr:hypothetical protein [Solirubrobacteraceae bacterium]
MADVYCRGCHATYNRPLPAPYGAICPDCIARGEIVTLTDVPRGSRGGRRRSAENPAPRGGPRSERQRASR